MLGRSAASGRLGVGHTVGIFHDRRGCFPGTSFDKVPLQGLATGDQAVMGIRKREAGKKGESRAAEVADAAANPDPVVILIVSLFAPLPVADDRVALTIRAMPNDRCGTGDPPVRSRLPRAAESGIKRIVQMPRLRPGRRPCKEVRPERSLVPLWKMSTEEE